MLPTLFLTKCGELPAIYASHQPSPVVTGDSLALRAVDRSPGLAKPVSMPHHLHESEGAIICRHST